MKKTDTDNLEASESVKSSPADSGASDVSRPMRTAMNQALWEIIALERGRPLDCAPITDPDQRRVLLSAKDYLMRALDLTT